MTEFPKEIHSDLVLEGPAAVDLYGISIHNVTIDEVMTEIKKWMGGNGKHYVTTPNVDHVVQLQRDSEFMEAYRRASLVIPDGLPIVWTSRILRKPLKERVSGSDLMLPVCEMAAREGRRVYLLGGLEGVAEKAREVLTMRFPSLEVAGCYSPPFGFESQPEENRKIVAQINQARTDILFIALGAPKQEKWIARHLQALEIKAAICVGAGIDFVAGIAKRAPKWMRQMGLEWSWRLAHEPKRLWRRYLVQDAAFLGLFLNEWLNLRGRKREVNS